jgi:membrane fusion protein, multidrug efflux system
MSAPSSSRSLSRGWLFGVFLLVVVVASACADKPSAEDTIVAKDTGALPVHVAVLEAASFADALNLYGNVEGKERVRITAEISGRIEALPFEENQPVKQGQTVARINARIAEAQVKQAAAQHELAKATFERTQRLYDKKLAAAADLDVTRAQAAQAEASHELSLANLEKAVVRSPIAGVVTRVTAKRGEVAAPGVPLLEVVELDEVNVVANVPERDVPLVDEGALVAIEVEAHPGRSFEGKVTRVSMVANGATRTFPVEVRVANQDRALRPGMLAKTRIVRKELAGVVVIPRDTVLDESEGTAVYVVEAGAAVRRQVSIGATRGRYTVATQGLAPGDVLMVLGHRQVVEGQKVSVKKTTTCCAAGAGGVRER